MIVTCEHCGARYKLDDSKITGRGAKITCPRCRHLFVVYRGAQDEPQAQPAASQGQPAASQGQPAASQGQPAASQGSAPAQRSPSRPAATPPQGQQNGGERRNIDVHSLDFRRVGIPSWKVKVKIGLVYDFSDYRTLRKYIQDGRVTPGDFLSYDGENWVPIEGIPDLEQYFIDVYLKREGEAKATGASADSMDDDGPTVIVGAGSLASSISASLGQSATPAPNPSPGMGSGSMAAAFAASVAQQNEGSGDSQPPSSVSGNGSGGSAAVAIPGLSTASTSLANPDSGADVSGGFSDPFEVLRSRQRSKIKARRRDSRTKPRKAATKKRRGQSIDVKTLVVAAVLLVSTGVVCWEIWIFWLKPPPPPREINWAEMGMQNPMGPEGRLPGMPGQQEEAQGQAKPDDKWSQFSIENIYEQAAQDRAPIDGTEDEEPWTAVAPRNLPSPIPNNNAGGGIARPSSATPSTAADHASVGASALGSGDYSTALQAFTQAAKLEPANGSHHYHLGLVRLRMGDRDQAYRKFEQAEKYGSSLAHREMGNIDRDRGDVASAVTHYTTYLNTNPQDAASVQAELDKLKGM